MHRNYCLTTSCPSVHNKIISGLITDQCILFFLDRCNYGFHLRAAVLSQCIKQDHIIDLLIGIDCIMQSSITDIKLLLLYDLSKIFFIGCLIGCLALLIIIIHRCDRSTPVIDLLILFFHRPVAVCSDIDRKNLSILLILKCNLSKIRALDLMRQYIHLLCRMFDKKRIVIYIVHVLQEFLVVHITVAVTHIFLLCFDRLIPIVDAFLCRLKITLQLIFYFFKIFLLFFRRCLSICFLNLFLVHFLSFQNRHHPKSNPPDFK